MRTTRAIQISFRASLRQYYRCTPMRCGVWNGVTVESFWRAQARIRALLSGRLGYVYSPTPECFRSFLMLCPRCHSQIQILTYPCTCIYETTNFLSGVSRGPSTILYCCRPVNSSSRCGTQRFVIVSCTWKPRLLNSFLVWCPHPNHRCPYGDGISTCLGT
jgi:hypothetical protein